MKAKNDEMKAQNEQIKKEINEVKAQNEAKIDVSITQYLFK